MIRETTTFRFFFWKYLGLIVVLVIGMTGGYFSKELLQLSSPLILLVAFMLIAIFSGFLVWKVWKTVNVQQETIEQLMGLKLVLASLIDLKDTYTEGHSKNVRDFALGLSDHLDLPKEVREEIGIAAELHDIGKIGIPDVILKKADKLKNEEYIEIQEHPQKGADSLKPLKGFDSIRSIICHHHERFDGRGYPDQLAGNQIPLGSRIIALADSYDAMLHGRSYRKAMPPQEVVQAISLESGKQFDPALISKFLDFLQQGSLSGHIDPVCGMLVDPNSSLFNLRYSNQSIRFCSKACMQAFEATPKKYMSTIDQGTFSSVGELSC
jgi:HD-GYP domain-containing protein (c-di-GMP phosphodiesterase class II)